MGKFLVWSSAAAASSGVGWWSYVLAQADPSNRGLWEIIQLGGTGGLVVCLLCAVTALWRDRQAMLDKLEELRASLLKAHLDHNNQLAELNRDHRTDVAAIAEKHKEDVERITERLVAELKSQITNHQQGG